MNEIIKVNEETMEVSARDLYDALGIRERFSLWADRQLQYWQDEWTSVGKPTEVDNNGGIQIKVLEDYTMSLNTAEHICLMCRTEKGRQCRQYLIDLEKAWNTPEQVMARAIKIANQTIASLTIQVEEMKPKAEYFDELVDRKLLTSFRDTAKELGVGEKEFIRYLMDRKYIYRDQKNQLRAYAEKNKGLFELKEYSARYSDHAGQQTMITPKGRETFRLLLKEA
ncbi:MAG: phage antirepressor KilAC domain-containing protein [Lachnospiraceae bacterium]|nr:phage antirepressor KilAC domain-containing protein [Lachnospiraceae bacterium]